MSLDSYNSQYPAAYYEVGTAYAFYTQTAPDAKKDLAADEFVKKFAKNLDQAIADNSQLVSGDGMWYAFNRGVGVVVGKKDNSITALFKTAAGEYVVKEFLVGGHNVYFNDSEVVQPSATIENTKSAGKKPYNSAKTGPVVDGVTGPVVEKVNKKTGPVVDGTTGPVVDK